MISDLASFYIPQKQIDYFLDRLRTNCSRDCVVNILELLGVVDILSSDQIRVLVRQTGVSEEQIVELMNSYFNRKEEVRAGIGLEDDVSFYMQEIGNVPLLLQDLQRLTPDCYAFAAMYTLKEATRMVEVIKFERGVPTRVMEEEKYQVQDGHVFMFYRSKDDIFYLVDPQADIRIPLTDPSVNDYFRYTIKLFILGYKSERQKGFFWLNAVDYITHELSAMTISGVQGAFKPPREHRRFHYEEEDYEDIDDEDDEEVLGYIEYEDPLDLGYRR
jgi:hypothetical protein